jgi:hypothetical protein
MNFNPRTQSIWVHFALMIGFTFSSVTAQAEPTISDLDLGGPEQQSPLEFCHDQEWAPSCLEVLMYYRCNQYGFPIPGSALECRFAAPLAVRALDIFQFNTVIERQNQQPQVYKTKLIFKNRLDQLIQEPATQTFLKNISIALENASDTRSGFDLYEATLKEANGNRFRALEWLGVLFQDTTFTVLPVKYFEEQFKNNKISKNEMEAVEYLRRALFILKPKDLGKSDYKKWISLYPSDSGFNLSQDLNPTIYHYYPMAYWSALLKKQKISNRLSFFLPFLFNADYEFQTMGPDRWPFKHPLPFELDQKGIHQTKDIYAGLSGALFGIQQTQLLNSVSEFSLKFSQDPFGEMQNWYWLDR